MFMDVMSREAGNSRRASCCLQFLMVKSCLQSREILQTVCLTCIQLLGFRQLLTCISVHPTFGKSGSEEIRKLNSVMDPMRQAATKQLRTHSDKNVSVSYVLMILCLPVSKTQRT